LLSRRHVLSGKAFNIHGAVLSHFNLNTFEAAHCFQYKGMVDKLPPYTYSVLLGKYDLHVYNESGSKDHSIWKYFLHPDWNFDGIRYDADISIIVLRQEVEYSDGIQPICLPQQSDDEVAGVGIVVGWGRSQKSNKYSSRPNKIEIPAINSSHCYTTESKLAIISSNRAFCGGYQNQQKGPCGGDSGNGFFLKESSKWSVHGIVSVGLADEEYGCDINNYILFTNVARFIDWIGQTMAKEVVFGKRNAECKTDQISLYENLQVSVLSLN
jgi:secreted trypsin-like serine protease